MTTSQRGVDLIKSFEGLSLKAVKLMGEQYWTIGYGHYGPDVQPGQKITKEQAEALLRQDLRQFETWVNTYVSAKARFKPNQNQFDALVSFCYNCGPGSLQTLIAGRTAQEVADHFLGYTKPQGSEAYRQGLINRRMKERALFLAPMEEDEEMERWHSLSDVPSGYYREQVERLINTGILAGKNGDLDLSEDMLRGIIFAERAMRVVLEDAQAENNWLSSQLDIAENRLEEIRSRIKALGEKLMEVG